MTALQSTSGPALHRDFAAAGRTGLATFYVFVENGSINAVCLEHCCVVSAIFLTEEALGKLTLFILISLEK